MKIAHFSTTDVQGGAALATYKLHTELIKLGIDSNMFVRNSVSPKPIAVQELKRINTIYEHKIKPRIQKLTYNKLKSNYQVPSHIPFSWNNLLPEYNLNISAIQNADIIGLYWIGEFLSPEIISKIEKPIVWRLSDIWPFSGGCHYPGTCTNYITGCGNCHYFKKPSDNDYSHKLNKKKKDLWKSLDITIAAPSKWIAELASKSNIFINRNIEIIKTGVDENHFKPNDKSVLRKIFNIPSEKTFILFGADSASDERKGIKYLIQALEYFKPAERKNIVLGIFGGNYDKSIDNIGFDVHYFGYVTETFLPILYNLSDVFIAPSIEENLPNTVIEAMSCGIPSVSFEIGGMPDLIQHRINGCMAYPRDAKSLYENIQYSLKNSESLGLEARKTILESFTQRNQANQYIKLYNKILKK
jgi:glycosyltransferase involved in cell wall biosynthesis